MEGYNQDTPSCYDCFATPKPKYPETSRMLKFGISVIVLYDLNFYKNN